MRAAVLRVAGAWVPWLSDVVGRPLAELNETYADLRSGGVGRTILVP